MKMKYPCLFLLLLALSSDFVSCKRYGMKSNTLHFPTESDDEKYGTGTRIISLNSDADSVHLRNKRDAAPPPKPSSGPADQPNDPEAHSGNITRFNLTDGHHQLMVHWVGQGSSTIIALAKDLHQTNTSNSSLYISYDYGTTFIRKDGQFRDLFSLTCLSGQHPKPMIIERFYHNKDDINAYVFADTVHNAILTTLDSGRSFSRHCLTFKPDQLSLNPVDHRVILSYDKNDPNKILRVSTNFGLSWRILDRNVKSFFWGVPPYDDTYDLYVERIEPYSGNKVLKYMNVQPVYISWGTYRSVTIIDRVQDFEVRDNFMFATKKVYRYGIDLILYISYDREPFLKTTLEDTRIHQHDFYVVDASENQVMLCINHNRTLTNLYVSEVHGSKFILSLERVVYFNPEGVNKDTWLRWFTDDSFADIHKVGGLRGIYIASQLLNQSNFSPYRQRTLISFNKGGRWHPIPAPVYDNNGTPTNCTYHNNCSLHLSQKLTQFYPGTHAAPVLSRESAPGIVIGTGMLGQSMNKTRMEDIFLSSDGGLTWNLVLQGHYIYEFGDHGGLIVAVLMFRLTREIRYSWNEGETWNTKVFSNESVYIYGLLTEPGEVSTIFSVFGSKPGIHQWVIFQINLRSVFPYICKKNDYKMWSPSDEIHQKTFMPCLMGRKTIIQRRIPHAKCYNGRHYERSVTVQNCTCLGPDFECDYGFKLRDAYSWQCISDPDSGVDVHKPPRYCTDFYYRSRGYRKIAGDTCQGGDEHRFMADKLTCPEAEDPEFLLYTRRTSIHSYNPVENIDNTIPISGLSNVAAIEYDFKGDCLYYADIHNDTINRLCLNANATNEGVSQVIIEGRMQAVEGLAFDWMSRNIYWVDAMRKTISVARADGTFRRTLIQNPAGNTTWPLDKPRGIAVDPMHGYLFWTDWSSTYPRIMKSWLDGQFIQPIVTGKDKVYWPNGITIDIQTERIYWVDAMKDRLVSATLNGTDMKVLVSGYNIPHPYGITIFKDEVFWTDWSKQAILAANKYTGHEFHVVKSALSGIMDLKYVHHAKQGGSNKCTNSQRGCSHLCIGRPDAGAHGNSRTCLCPDFIEKKVATGGGNERCQCPVGSKFHTDGQCYDEGAGNFTTCDASQYRCQNDRCVPSTWKCDHDNDCGDNSDEKDCPYLKCQNGYFECTNGRCILGRWKCDHDDDCHDNSDERNCTYSSCNNDQFTCNNGRCISGNWTCDGDDDCHDGSDEDVSMCHNRTIHGTTASPRPCSIAEFQCHNRRQCVQRHWVCDGAADCNDGSDEWGCASTTKAPGSCHPWQFACDDGHCIPRYWKCDGKRDCHSGSDEASCWTSPQPVSTTPSKPSNQSCHWWQFNCRNGNCVYWTRECDGQDDCGDYSDEYDCHRNETTTNRPVVTCRQGQYTCDSGQCINNHYRCNGYYDCRDGSDERYCQQSTVAPMCNATQFRCNNGHCIYSSWICDGDRDCSHGEDELNCHNGTQCVGPNHFKCLYSSGCLPSSWICDGDRDCTDGSDELGCVVANATVASTTVSTRCLPQQFKCYDGYGCVASYRRCNGIVDCLDGSDENVLECGGELVVGGLGMIHRGSDNITVGWSPPKLNSTQSATLTYIPLIRVDKRNTPINWVNHTAVSGTTLTFTGLAPYTKYRITVYVMAKLGSTQHSYRPARPIEVVTLQGKPSPPLNLVASVADINSGKVKLTWLSPKHPNGIIDHYLVRYHNVSSTGKAGHAQEEYFMPTNNVAYISHLTYGQTWVFTIQAESVEMSDASNAANVTLESKSPFMTVTDLKANILKETEVNLTWSLDKAVAMKYHIDSYEAECYASGTDHYLKLSGYMKWAHFTGLNPKTYYQCNVKVHNKYGFGPRSPEVDFLTHGQAIPAVGNLSLSLVDHRAVKVTWTVARKGSWVYTVIYDYHGEHMIGDAGQNLALASHVNTTKQYYTLKNLVGCEVYNVRVLVTGPNGWGPASKVKNVATDYDMTRKPKKIQILNLNDPSAINVTWSIYCEREAGDLDELGYEIAISENGDKPRYVDVKKSRNVTYARLVKNLIRGATYTISVRPDFPGGHWGDWQVKTAKPYPGPLNLFESSSGNQTFFLNWELSNDRPKTIPGYEVWMCHTHKGKCQPTDYRIVKTTKNPNVTFSLRWLQEKFNLEASEVTKNHPKFSAHFKFKVRLMKVNGYYSDFSSQEPFDLGNSFSAYQEPSTQGLSMTNLIAIIVSMTVICLVLAVALGVYFIRHRRLQRSFLSFANSHYDTRSGRTRFSTGDHELDGEEDQPMITGFSDDEPLVIA
ncbi:sortilin-related receptor-like isoform X2 [Lineus longissimus]|uniref:sortilin-related receptor-like isoform X2 n=1 Tax=Lineus longissimus TaxID=88925 RepID=UPI00315D5CEA